MKKYLNSMPTVAFFSVAYFCFFWLQVNGLQEFNLSPMASILFLPAGVKFLAMLVGGLWGVLGIAVGKIWVEQYLGNDISLTGEITPSTGLVDFSLCMSASVSQEEKP